MMPRSVARGVARALDRMRSGVALRGATKVGEGVRVLGWTQVANAGELVVGRGVVLVSTPAPIAIVVAPGATVVVGEGTVVESGATIRARWSIRIGGDVRIGAGAILDDDGPERGAIEIGDGAWIADGAVLTAGSRVGRREIVSRAGAPSDRASRPAEAIADRASVREEAADAGLDGGALDPAVAARVRTVLSRIVPSAVGVEEDAGWTDLKGWDSLAALRILVALEREFAIVLPSQLLAKGPTLASVATIVAAARVQRGVERGVERGQRS